MSKTEQELLKELSSIEFGSKWNSVDDCFKELKKPFESLDAIFDELGAIDKKAYGSLSCSQVLSEIDNENTLGLFSALNYTIDATRDIKIEPFKNLRAKMKKVSEYLDDQNKLIASVGAQLKSINDLLNEYSDFGRKSSKAKLEKYANTDTASDKKRLEKLKAKFSSMKDHLTTALDVSKESENDDAVKFFNSCISKIDKIIKTATKGISKDLSDNIREAKIFGKAFKTFGFDMIKAFYLNSLDTELENIAKFVDILVNKQ